MMSRRLDRSDPLAEIGALLGELYTPEEIVGWLFGQHSAFGKPAAALISEGQYDTPSAWSFDAADGDKLLGPKGDDWAKYGRWHLGEDPSEPDTTKAHWKYPYGKDGKVYRRAVAAIRSRASQEGATQVFEAAGKLMSAMDDEDGKKEQSGMLHRLLGSRFGHFAATAPATLTAAAPAAPDDEDDDEGKRAAAKKAEDDEEMRKAEERKEEEARRARRARRARKGKAEKGEDDDEAADDDEEMKRAASAGHSFALDAAFRAGARAQRVRCGKIFDAKAAAATPAMAASLAFETPLTAAAAIALLEKAPSATRSGLAERMALSGAGNMRVGPGTAEAPQGAVAIASSWDRALKDLAPAR